MPELRKCPLGHEFWFPGERWKHESCVSNESVSNQSESTVSNKSVDYLRVKLWREANKVRYNEKQREYMRTRRAKNKTA